MKQRIISSIIYFALLLCILLVDIPLVDTMIILLLSVIAMHEYNKAFKSVGYHPIEPISYIGCGFLFLMGNIVPFEDKMLIVRVALPALIILLFVYIILKKLKITVVDIALTVFSLLYIPFLFSFIKLILSMPNGRILIWFVLLGAFASDMMAYFIGCKFGKKKICPEISPKKTVEGSIAGIVGVIISYIILAFIMNHFYGYSMNIFLVALMGLVASIVGQFGDLSASSIKRYCGIKDFGSIMPGHGGILDRCDSILFVAPIVYMFLKFYLFM